MTSLFIKDLSRAQLLDREAASAVRGGDNDREIDPGFSPGYIAPPWAMPALPDFPLLPPWCGAMPLPQAPLDPTRRYPTEPSGATPV
jgi:hypothetical protein